MGFTYDELCFCAYRSVGGMGNRCRVVLTGLYREMGEAGSVEGCLGRQGRWGFLTTSILCPASLFLWQGPCGQRGSSCTPSLLGWVLPPLASAAGPGAGTSAKAQLRSKISIEKPGLALVVGESFIRICSALSILCRCSALMRESWVFFLLPLPQ